MKRLLVRVGVSLVGVVVGLGSLGFGYSEFKKSQAREVCAAFEAHKAQDQELVVKGRSCLDALRDIPFKTAKQHEDIGKAEAALSVAEALIPVKDAFSKAAEDLKSFTPVQPSPIASTVASVQAAPARAAVKVVPQQTPFEALSHCDQLDALAKGGKSVSEFILGSADPNAYIWAIKTDCNWHQSQADVAYNVLNPPVVVQPVTVVQQVSQETESSGGSWESSTPTYRENNCNGIREPGEAYSARCDQLQQQQHTSRPVEGTCYRANPADCPRNLNGNPSD